MPPSLESGIAEFNAREYYRCHETLEDLWRIESGPRRLFLQAIIHLAVAFYHAERRNPAGAIRQLRKGLRKLEPYRPVYENVDTERLYRDAESALALLVDNCSLPPPVQIVLQA